MAKISREDIDQLNIKLTIDIPVSDYKKKFENALTEYNNKTAFKGFRAGHAPMSYLKKVYGKGVLANVVNDFLQAKLNEYLEENKVVYLGQPIPTQDDDQEVDFNPHKLSDFKFVFELGLAPEFEVQGVGASDSFNKYKVEVSDEEIEKELAAAQKRLGESVETEDKIIEDDLVKFKATEKDGEVNAEFSVAFDQFSAPALKKVKGKKVGHTFSHDIFKLEKDTPADAVKKHMLGLKEEDEAFEKVGNKFDFEIISVNRVTLAERDEEFFKKYFGEEAGITDEAGAKESIRERIATFYDGQANIILNKSIEERLLESNKLELPEGFLKRWLLMTSEQDLTEDILAKEFEGFKMNLVWSLISGKLGKQYEVQVTQEDVKNAFRQDLMQYMGGQAGNFPTEMLDNYINQMMENQEQVETKYREQMTQKVFAAVQNNVTIVEDTISNKDFEDLIKKLNEEYAAKNEAAESEAETTEEVAAE